MSELTGIAEKYRDARRSVGVALAVGLAPLLGLHPLFKVILDPFPQNLSRALIPAAAFMMTLPALAVHYVAQGRRWVVFTTLAFVVLLAIALCFFYGNFVTMVTFEGRRGVAYVTGSKMLSTCPCVASHLEIENCIGRGGITFDPAQVTGCYPAAEIRTRKTLLSASYVMLMMSVGTLIGLIVARLPS